MFLPLLVGGVPIPALIFELLPESFDAVRRQSERAPGLPGLGVPASLAVEAHDCLSIKADRAAVSLARAVVEASAKEKGVTRGSLVAKIDELHQLGLLRGHIKEAAHEVRFGGNEVAHGGLTPVDHEAAEEILTLRDEVLNDLFQSPARVARARQRRLERSQAGTASVNTTASEGQPSI